MAKSAKSSANFETTRTTSGRFGKGNPGGPGAPLGGLVAQLRTALLQSVTPEDIREVGQALLRQAKDGDLNATKLLLTYTVGTPSQPIATDTSAADALEAQNRWHTAQRIAELNSGFGGY